MQLLPGNSLAFPYDGNNDAITVATGFNTNLSIPTYFNSC